MEFKLAFVAAFLNVPDGACLALLQMGFYVYIFYVLKLYEFMDTVRWCTSLIGKSF